MDASLYVVFSFLGRLFPQPDDFAHSCKDDWSCYIENLQRCSSRLSCVSTRARRIQQWRFVIVALLVLTNATISTPVPCRRSLARSSALVSIAPYADQTCKEA